MHVKDSIVLVTGANRGLGKAFVDNLILRGATKVYAGARDIASLEPLVDAHGSTVTPIQLDVTNDDSVYRAAKIANDITLLINNAGVLERQGLIEAGNLAPLRHELDVNLFGIARMCLAFTPVLKTGTTSAILNVLSVASLHGFAPFGTYCVSKAAAMSLTQSLRYELRDQGTTVHGIYAGFITTDMTAGIQDEMSTPQDIVDKSLNGLEAGDMDINADDRSEAIRTLLREADFDTIQQAYHDRADEHYRTHGKNSR